MARPAGYAEQSDDFGRLMLAGMAQARNGLATVGFRLGELVG